jgi:hypothetical protein
MTGIRGARRSISGLTERKPDVRPDCARLDVSRRISAGFEQFGHAVEFARLVEEVVCAERKAARAHGGRVAVGQHDGEQVWVVALEMLQHAEAAAFAQLQVDHGGVEGGAVERGDGRRFGIDLAADADALAVLKQCDEVLADQQRVLDSSTRTGGDGLRRTMSGAIPRQYACVGGRAKPGVASFARSNSARCRSRPTDVITRSIHSSARNRSVRRCS